MINLYLLDTNWKNVQEIEKINRTDMKNSFIGVLRTIDQDNLFDSLAVLNLLKESLISIEQIIISPISKSFNFCIYNILKNLESRDERIRIINLMDNKNKLSQLLENSNSLINTEKEQVPILTVNYNKLVNHFEKEAEVKKIKKFIFQKKEHFMMTENIKTHTGKIRFTEKKGLSDLSDLIYPQNIKEQR